MKSNVTILCHRGWWEKPEEQNTLAAFARAFDAGLGVELDVRDSGGYLVVAHDPRPGDDLDSDVRKAYPSVRDEVLFFDEFIDLLAGRDLPLAVNVKSCGLAPLFAKVEPKPKSWFFFDVAPGDEESYPKNGLELFVREHWDTANPILTISPEIFGRGGDIRIHWKLCHDFPSKAIFLITDRVREAMEFFK